MNTVQVCCTYWKNISVHCTGVLHKRFISWAQRKDVLFIWGSTYGHCTGRLQTTQHTYTLFCQKYEVRCCASPSSCGEVHMDTAQVCCTYWKIHLYTVQVCCINGSFHVYKVKMCCTYGDVHMDTVQVSCSYEKIYMYTTVKVYCINGWLCLHRTEFGKFHY